MTEKTTSNIVSYTWDEIKAIKIPDDVWERFDALTDEDIDCSDIPELTEEERRELKPARFFVGDRKPLIDADLLDWFIDNFDDYRTEINKALKEYRKTKN